MAPGTKPQQERDMNLGIKIENEEFDDMMENVELPEADPWHVADPNQGIIIAANAVDQSFEDAFVHSPGNEAKNQPNYEHNRDYLAYLEAKLHRMESRRKTTHKVTARDVLDSLKDAKEVQLNWNMQQVDSSTEDDVAYSDSSASSGYSLSKELKRKMFPEQQALNDSELLHLLEHDVIDKIFGQFLKTGDKQ